MAKILCFVTTFEPLAGLRFEMLEETLRSMTEAFPGAHRELYDNNSADGSWEALEGLAKKYSWPLWKKTGERSERTPGHARSAICGLVRNSHAQPDDIVVFSDDDMRWRPGSEDRIREAWANAPIDLRIICGLLEPDYPWAKPLWAVQLGKERVLVRQSAPGAAWTMTVDRLRTMPAIQTKFGYDSLACAELRSMGMSVAQMDLATHLGADSSTHGNDQRRKWAPIDRERWGV